MEKLLRLSSRKGAWLSTRTRGYLARLAICALLLSTSTLFEPQSAHLEAAGAKVAKRTKTFRHYGFAKDAARFKDGLRRNAYATTAQGSPLSGATAQDKLGLKHPQPPDSFYLVTIDPKTTRVKGPRIERPSKNPPRTGGGKVYEFPDGTPPGSVTGPFRIPAR